MTPTERKALEAGRDALASVSVWLVRCSGSHQWAESRDAALSLINDSLQEQGEQEERIATLEAALKPFVLDPESFPYVFKGDPELRPGLYLSAKHYRNARSVYLSAGLSQEQGEQEGWWVKPEWRESDTTADWFDLMLSGRRAGSAYRHDPAGEWWAYRCPPYSGLVGDEGHPTLEAAKAALIEAVRPKPPAPPSTGGE